ncbi:hypothetical protein TanjilG_25649 [Lupinus angustifolius]|uniref:S-protein homolog n=1 Tax=Lupinus angustifolius TaxID=3871 RepID=A0A4P1QTH9_LUPAN|nr:hypothetical protein TanjilG_25649 [Lupinus angustifolius]
MSTLNYVALILGLATCLYNHVADARVQPIDNIKAVPTVQVSIQVGLPRGESSANIICDILTPNRYVGFDLPPGGTKTLTVAIFAIYKCDATWKGKKATFVAYDKTRDTSQNDVYWILDPLGFYLSYDQHDWKRVGGW